jgi:hypothetical protein
MVTKEMKFTESNLFVVTLWLDLLPEEKDKKGTKLQEERVIPSECFSIQSMPMQRKEDERK